MAYVKKIDKKQEEDINSARRWNIKVAKTRQNKKGRSSLKNKDDYIDN